MVVVLRHDVDNPIWNSVPMNYIFLRLKNQRIREWGLVSHYLEDVKNLLNFEVSHEIKSTWFFRTCTIPNTNIIKKLLEHQHEIGYHTDRDQTYETFINDLKILEHYLGEIKGVTHHGWTRYNHEKLVEFVRKSGLRYIAQGVLPKEIFPEPKTVEDVLIFDSHVTLKAISNQYDNDTGKKLLLKYINENEVAQILMHPRQYMISEKVRMLFKTLVETVPKHDFVTHKEVIDTLCDVHRATADYMELKPVQSQLARAPS